MVVRVKHETAVQVPNGMPHEQAIQNAETIVHGALTSQPNVVSVEIARRETVYERG